MILKKNWEWGCKVDFMAVSMIRCRDSAEM